jgi:hypothetical protein
MKRAASSIRLLRYPDMLRPMRGRSPKSTGSKVAESAARHKAAKTQRKPPVSMIQAMRRGDRGSDGCYGGHVSDPTGKPGGFRPGDPCEGSHTETCHDASAEKEWEGRSHD